MRITPTQYARALYKAAEGKSGREIEGVIAGLMKVLEKKRQKKILSKIIEKFDEIYNRKNKIAEAEIISMRGIKNIRLPDGQAIAEKIKDFVQKNHKAEKVILREKIDEKIKGGIVVRVGNEILDGSAARRLRSLRDALIK